MEYCMTEMICITCPLGCHLEIERLSESEIAVTGNRCARGEQYAQEEILSPRRVVTATCRCKATVGDSIYRPRRIPLRTKGNFPKERIPELLKLIYGMELSLPVARGQVVIADALGTGVDVIVARSM
jgi:CxxC motif-containing protein